MPIDQTTQFDLALIYIGDQDDTLPPSYITLYLRSAADPAYETGVRIPRVGRVSSKRVNYRIVWDLDDPEVAEVVRRLKNGTCELRFGSYPGVPLHEYLHSDWIKHTLHPFNAHKIHLFFEHLAEFGEYVEATRGVPARFRFPGVVEGDPPPGWNEIKVYKRAADTPSKPAVPFTGDHDAMLGAFADAGWTVQIPDGFDDVFQFRQEYGVMADGSAWWDPGLVFRRPGVLIGYADKLRQSAKAYRVWEDALTAANTQSSYTATKEWWKTWLGYAWEQLQTAGALSVEVWTDDNPRVRRTISGRDDVLAWTIDHLYEWAGRGVETFRTTANTAIVAANLVEPSLTKIKADGTQGETLVGTVEAADWARYQGDSYRSAAEIVSQVTVTAGADKAVVSGGMVTLDGVVTVEDGHGDTTILWARESGTGGALSATDVAAPTLTAPILMVGDDPVVLQFRITATNDGVSATDVVAVTVTAPVGE